MKFVVCLLLLSCASAKAQTNLPDEPVVKHEVVKPFAFGLSAVERATFTASGNITFDFIPSAFLNYRFDKNAFNLNTAVGRSQRTGNFSITSSLSFNLFKFGRISR